MGVGTETHSQTLYWEIVKMEVSIRSLPLEIREPCRKGGRNTVAVRGVEGTRRTWSAESNKAGLTIEVASTSLQGFIPGPLRRLWLLAGYFCGSRFISDSCLPWGLFLLLDYLVQPWYEGFSPLICCLLFFTIWLLRLGGPLFSERKQKGSRTRPESSWGREAGRVEGGETGWNVLYERKICSHYF